ncbi:MAG: amidohydrolase family protein [Oscillospiraceae bacterium]|nr:amidohydrolase family protein [Oscillospiraceae bacterium]
MSGFVLKGHICHSADKDRIEILEDHYLICEDGICRGAFAVLPEAYASLPVQDMSGKLIIPGLSDLHIHASQFGYRGLGMDMELLEWLEHHAFPEERKFADLDYAELAYGQFVRHLRRSETTRACIFTTIHREATELLMEKMEESGLVSYVGKVNMDRHCPEFLQEKDESETRLWLEHTAGKYQNTKPIITPRFIPSCTDGLLYAIGRLSREYDVPVQSHVSENLSEIQWVKELVPDAVNYGDAYAKFDLFGKDGQKCLMSHCVYSDEREMAMMKENGVVIAHSPESNMNVASGVAPINRYLDYGLRVGLATDVAGGSHESMFRAMIHAIQSSKLRWRLLDQSVAPLTFDTAFYLATRGGGVFFGKVGAFEDGFEFDALVLDDANLDHPQQITTHERLERIVYLGDERNIIHKYVRGVGLF